MDLNGNVKLPGIGEVKTKYVLVAGGVAALIVGTVWYRTKKSKAAAATSGAIDPATGYTYGSAEDSAALAAQGSSLPGQSGSGGTGTVPGGTVPGIGFRTNAEWVQSVLAYVQSNGTDVAGMQTALGLYINGEPAGAYRSLIEQAIAVQGYPPVSGANGYPPSINTNNPTTPTNNPTPDPTPTPGPEPTPAPTPGPTYTYVTVQEGNHVDPLLRPGFTLADLQALNPNIRIAWANGNGYISATNPDRGGAIAVFNVGTSAQVKIPA